MPLPSHLTTIGSNIKTARKIKGWTQQQLADEAGYAWERLGI